MRPVTSILRCLPVACALALVASCSSPTPVGTADAASDAAAASDQTVAPMDAPSPTDSGAPADRAAPEDRGTLAQQVVGPAGGVVSAPGIRVEIPAGALAADTAIAIRQLAPEERIADQPVVSPVFALDPPGTTFAQPVTVRIDADRARAGSGPFDALDSVAVMHRSSGTDPWDVIGADDAAATAGVGTTTSFSSFALVLIRASGCMDPRRVGGVCSSETCGGGNETCGQRCTVRTAAGVFGVACTTPAPGGSRVTCVCDNNGTRVTLRSLTSSALGMDSNARRFVAAQYRAGCAMPCDMNADAGVDAGSGPMDAPTVCHTLTQQATPVDEQGEGFTRPPWDVRAVPPDGTWLLTGRSVNIMTSAAGRATVTLRLRTSGGTRTLDRVETRTVGGAITSRSLSGTITFETPTSGDNRYQVALGCDSEGRASTQGEFRYDAAANQIHWRWNPLGYGFGETFQLQGTTAPDAGPPPSDVVDAGAATCAYPTQRAVAVRGTEIPGTPSSCLTGGAIPAGVYTVTRYTGLFSDTRDYEHFRTYEVGAPRAGSVQDIGLIERSRQVATGGFTTELRWAGEITTGQSYVHVYCPTDASVGGPLTRNVQATIQWRCPTPSGQQMLYSVTGDTVEVQFWARASFQWGETWTRWTP